MKVKEVKKVLAEKINSYKIVVKKEENGEMFEFEYSLDLNKQSPEYRLLTILFLNKEFKEIDELEVKYVGCDDGGFIIGLNSNDYTILEKIAKENRIPLTIRKCIVLD